MLDCSVLITCFNKEDYLDECVTSVLQQTRVPKEIIIVHDGCDNPVAHEKAHTIILKDNEGVAKARNRAFQFSTGNLILFVDGDDKLSPDYLERMALVISKGADIAFPDIYFWAGVNSKLSIIPDKITPKFVQDFNKVVIPVTSLMHRNVYTLVGGFREWPVLEDLDFFIRAMSHDFKFRKAHTLLYYRRGGATRNMMELGKRKEVLKEILGQFEFRDNKVYAKIKL